MKFKKHNYRIDVAGIPKDISADIDLEIKSCFFLKAVPVNEEQAKKMAEILYPDMNIKKIEMENVEA